MREVLKEVYVKIYGAFVFYGSQGTGDPYHMSMNAFTSFLDDCAIPDNESQNVKRSDCDTMFIICNYQPDKKSAEAAVNMENAMMRYEVIEAICRIGLGKYGKGIETLDVAGAIRMLLERNIVPRLSPACSIDSNQFRNERLYNEEVDIVLKRNVKVLQAIYSRYRLKPSSGGLRPKALKLDGFLQLMTDACLIDGQFTLAEASLCFLWSRMLVIDEIKDYNRYSCVTFTDFLEAICRVADYKFLPTHEELAAAEYESVFNWALELERFQGNAEALDENGESSIPEIFRYKGTGVKFEFDYARPLWTKVELLIDLMLRRLFWDPMQPEQQFTVNAVMKMVVKIDKDLGP